MRCRLVILSVLVAASLLAAGPTEAKTCAKQGCRVASGQYRGHGIHLNVHVRGARKDVTLVQSDQEQRAIRGRCTGSVSSVYTEALDPGVGLGVFHGPAPVIGRVSTYRFHFPFPQDGYTDTFAGRLDVHFLTSRKARLAVTLVDVITKDDDAGYRVRCRGTARFGVKR